MAGFGPERVEVAELHDAFAPVRADLARGHRARVRRARRDGHARRRDRARWSPADQPLRRPQGARPPAGGHRPSPRSSSASGSSRVRPATAGRGRCRRSPSRSAASRTNNWVTLLEAAMTRAPARDRAPSRPLGARAAGSSRRRRPAWCPRHPVEMTHTSVRGGRRGRLVHHAPRAARGLSLAAAHRAGRAGRGRPLRLPRRRDARAPDRLARWPSRRSTTSTTSRTSARSTARGSSGAAPAAPASAMSAIARSLAKRAWKGQITCAETVKGPHWPASASSTSPGFSRAPSAR